MTPRESTETHNLQTALAALRAEYRDQPPEHIETALRARFVERRRSNAARRWGLGIAAAVAAISAIVFWLLPSPGQAPARKVATAPVVIHAMPERPPAIREQPVRATHTLTPTHNRHATAVRTKTVPEHPDFLALPYAEPLSASEPINVYRVQLPRVTLAQFGLPLRPGALDSTVTADVVVGSDGVARAIRFVQ
jgi:hypothetical protein